MQGVGSTLEDTCDQYVGRALVVEPHYGWGWIHQEGQPFSENRGVPPSFHLQVVRCCAKGDARGGMKRKPKKKLYLVSTNKVKTTARRKQEVEILWGGVVGFLASLLATFCYARWLAHRQWKRFEPICGTYKAYAIGEKGVEKIDYADQRGTCTIRYISDNVLFLHYKETQHEHIWQAYAWMETPTSGSLAWRYIKLAGAPATDHKFGFTRCIFVDGSPKKYLYLVGDRVWGYGKEALEKQE